MRAWPILFAALAACGGGSGTSNTPCSPGGDGTYVVKPYDSLSQYCLLGISDSKISLKTGVTPYDLNTPLFSDYATKARAVWLPAGTTATYDAANAFSFPTGALLIKSFGFKDDVRDEAGKVSWIETRLLIKTDGGWQGYTYVWNDARTEATLDFGGKVLSRSIVDDTGATQSLSYLVPSFNQCKQCHADKDGTVALLGVKARNLNRDFAYAGGTENQLHAWARLGLLAGAPDAAAAPKLPTWNDPTTGSVSERARAYLEVNCAHCHSETGAARTTGLYLAASQTNPIAFGVCKSPVAAGEASGGLLYDVVPGNPDASILNHRLLATSPSVAMPQIGRSVVDAKGTGLVRAWISGLAGSCHN